jgi:large subunit ribosomal protein L5
VEEGWTVAKEKQQDTGKAKDKAKGSGGRTVKATPRDADPAVPAITPRLKTQYRDEIVKKLLKEHSFPNVMAVPRLTRIVLNMGIGEGATNIRLIEQALVELEQITGQKGAVTRARKSIANFKLREGMPIGARVTLRGDRMYEFFDRLVNITFPRVPDFRGLSVKSFDGRGNYTMGLNDQLAFPEIDYSRVEHVKGMNITFVTTANTDAAAEALLRALGFPLQQRREELAADGSAA